MGEKIPIINEKKVNVEGIYDMKETYKFLKNFLEESRHYDVSEKDYEEKNNPESRMIKCIIEAEQEYNDYYKVIIKYEIALNGKDMTIEQNGRNLMLTQGKASLTVNAYVEPDFMNKRPKGGLAGFFEKIYEYYFGSDELGKVIGSAAGDVGEFVNRFKQSLNSTLK